MNVFVVLLVCVGLILLFSSWRQRSYYSSDHPILNKVKENFSVLNPEYGKIPLREGDSSYTENKAYITLCIRDPKTKGYYDMNTIMYVALHELAHVVSKTHGHNDEFKKNFATLLRQAARQGIYDPRKSIPTTYCGIGPED